MISTHILDTSSGTPAGGILVRLEKKEAETWKEISKGMTNADGRFSFEAKNSLGTFRIVFEVETYFKKNNTTSFYSNIPVVFVVQDQNRKYHVPLLLNPFGYSTYRGS